MYELYMDRFQIVKWQNVPKFYDIARGLNLRGKKRENYLHLQRQWVRIFTSSFSKHSSLSLSLWIFCRCFSGAKTGPSFFFCCWYPSVYFRLDFVLTDTDFPQMEINHSVCLIYIYLQAIHDLSSKGRPLYRTEGTSCLKGKWTEGGNAFCEGVRLQAQCDHRAQMISRAEGLTDHIYLAVPLHITCKVLASF